MNVWQVCQVLQSILRSKTWAGGTNKVFDPDSVRVIPQGDEIADLDEGLIPPLCLIMPLSGDIDPDHREESDLVRRTLDVTIVTVNQGDRVGETPIMGGMRVDRTQSAGRGLAEIEVPLFEAIKKLGIDTGIIIQFAGYGEGQVRRSSGDQYIGIQDYTFQVWCSVAESFSPAYALAATGGTGEVSLTWTNPTVLPTTYQGILVRKAGLVAPTSVSDGTTVLTTTSLAASSYVDSGLAPGTYSYSFFVTYDLTHSPPSEAQVTSSPVSVTGVIAS